MRESAINAERRRGIGEPYRKEPWVGSPIAAVLGLSEDKRKDKRDIDKIVRGWLQAGWLKKVEKLDAHRKPKDYVEVGKTPVDAPAAEAVPNDMSLEGPPDPPPWHEVPECAS